MTPAAVLSILIKTSGAAAATGQLNAVNSAGARAGGTFESLSKQATSAGRSLRAAGGGMTHGVTLPLVALGVAAGKASSDFQKAMEMIHTQAGASQKEVNGLKGEVLNLAKGAKQGPVELANALYRLEGAGLRGQKAMKALKAASDLAAVGNADVEDTAKTLSQTWFSGIRGAKNFKKVVAELNATVGAGDLRLQNLVDALGTGILPVARQAGLKLRDITGVLATFGDETKNVDGWAAQFSTALHYLYAPTSKAEKALSSIGLTGRKLGQDMRGSGGLLSALKDLRDHLGKLSGGARGLDAAQVLSKILPGGRGRVISVLLNQLDRYQAKLQQIGSTTSRFGDAVAKTQQTAAFKIGNAWARVQASFVKLGDALLPVVVPIFQKIAGAVSSLADRFSALSPHTKKLIVEAALVAAALGPVLVTLGAVAIAIGALISPIGLTIAAVAGLAAGFGLAYAKSATFRSGVGAVIAAAKTAATAISGAAMTVDGGVKAGFTGAAGWVTAATRTVLNEVRQWDTLASFVKRAFTGITDAAKAWFAGLKVIFQVGLTALGPIVVAQFALIKGVFSGAFTILKGIVTSGFTALRGVVKILGGLFKGDFGQMWDGVKTIFHGEITALKSILEGTWKILKAPVDAIGAGIHDAFSNSWDRIKGVFRDGVNTVIDFLNVLIDAINAIPGVPDIKKIGKVGTAAGGGGKKGVTAQNLQAAGFAQGGAFGRTGGLVNSPMVMMGEDAPRYPEFVIPTNPAYRQRAHGLLAQAAGTVGLAKGGVLGKVGGVVGGAVHAVSGAVSSVLGSLPKPSGLGMFEGLGKYVVGKVTDWAKGEIGKLFSSGSGSAGAGGPVPAGNARDWLTQALKITGHFSAGNLSALFGRMMQESGGNPHAINLWDSNAAAGHPSKGLLQTIDSTFASYALPGHGDIWNPVDNAIAAIRYMFAAYGHIVGASNTGYATGTSGAKPGFAWVGERGPELVRFKGGEQVIPHGMSMQMAGSALRGYSGGTKPPKKGHSTTAGHRSQSAIAITHFRHPVAPQKGLTPEQQAAIVAARPATPTNYDILAAKLAQAQLTKDTADDLAVLKQIQAARQQDYNLAVSSGDVFKIAQTATDLKSVNDQIDSLGPSLQDLTDAITSLNAEIKRNSDIAKSYEASDAYQATKTLADILSDHYIGRGVMGRRRTPGSGVAFTY